MHIPLFYFAGQIKWQLMAQWRILTGRRSARKLDFGWQGPSADFTEASSFPGAIAASLAQEVQWDSVISASYNKKQVPGNGTGLDRFKKEEEEKSPKQSGVCLLARAELALRCFIHIL